jgi:PD-(D/E)XK nuclease superfamily
MYVKMSVDRRLPFQTFPGIFASFDSLNKKMVEKHFDVFGYAPTCFEGIPASVGYEKAEMTEVQDDTTGIHVKGQPDAVFKLKGGKIAIIDYKTARYTAGQDHLLPMYNVQLNVYNYLRVVSGQSPADKLFLIYLEPETRREDGEYHKYLTDTGYHLDFSAKVVELELRDDEYVPALLKRLKKLCLLKSAPSGIEDCKECKLLDQLVRVMDAEVGELDGVLVNDMLTLARNDDGIVNDSIRHIRSIARFVRRHKATITDSRRRVA